MCIYLTTSKQKTAFEKTYSCQLIEISCGRCCFHLQMLQHEVCQFLHCELFPLSGKEAETMSNLMRLMHVSLPLFLYFQHSSEALLYGLELFWLSSALEFMEAELPCIFFHVVFNFTHFPYFHFVYIQWVASLLRLIDLYYINWCNLVCFCDYPIFFCLLKDCYVQ